MALREAPVSSSAGLENGIPPQCLPDVNCT